MEIYCGNGTNNYGEENSTRHVVRMRHFENCFTIRLGMVISLSVFVTWLKVT